MLEAVKVYYIPKHEISDKQCREGLVVEPKAIADMIRSARRPLLIVGGKLLENEKLVEYAVKFYKKGIPIVATGASSKPLIERGVKPLSASRSLHYIIQYLLDESWKGFDGKGSYDLILFMGFIPAYLSRMLSALKHFSDIITISIDEFYQPNAKFSLTDFALVVREDQCIGCGNCVIVCPYNAIECQSIIKNGRRLVVDVRFCRDCEYVFCMESCPYDAIEFRKGGEIYYKALDEILENL
jgi:acetyl-CoA decarbonylase/synthase complex subunit epsilon